MEEVKVSYDQFMDAVMDVILSREEDFRKENPFSYSCKNFKELFNIAPVEEDNQFIGESIVHTLHKNITGKSISVCAFKLIFNGSPLNGDVNYSITREFWVELAHILASMKISCLIYRIYIGDRTYYFSSVDFIYKIKPNIQNAIKFELESLNRKLSELQDFKEKTLISKGMLETPL